MVEVAAARHLPLADALRVLVHLVRLEVERAALRLRRHRRAARLENAKTSQGCSRGVGEIRR